MAGAVSSSDTFWCSAIVILAIGVSKSTTSQSSCGIGVDTSSAESALVVGSSKSTDAVFVVWLFETFCVLSHISFGFSIANCVETAASFSVT